MNTARSAFLVALALVAVTLAAPGRASAAPPVVSESPRVRIESGVPSQATADKARAVAEAALALAEARVPYKLPDSRPVVIHLHPSAAAYEDALISEGEGASSELATTLPKRQESHVLVAPRSDPEYLALVDDLPQLSRYHIAYSTVSLLLRLAHAPSLEWWPDWYFEGICESIALDVVQGKDDPRPILIDDVFDHLREASTSGRVFPVARVLAAHEIAPHAIRRVQAHWVALYRVLESEPEKLAKLHEKIRNLPAPLPPEKDARDFRALAFAKLCGIALEGVFGPVAALDARLKAFAAASAPAWFDVLRWSQFFGGELFCAVPAGSTAMAVSEKPAPGVPFSISCEMKLLNLGAKQGEIYLGYERRDDPRFVKVAFSTDDAHAYVTLLAYADGAWQSRLRVNVEFDKAALPAGVWIPIKVGVGGGLLRVDFHGQKLIELPAPEGFELLNARVGFGAFDGVAIFRKIVVEATPPTAPAPTPPAASPPAALPEGPVPAMDDAPPK